uniref:ETF domain-containing protein n=1 Tax=Glossina pallidipes TaxID=7398 RepID=A0A1A9Z2I3_GLOPL
MKVNLAELHYEDSKLPKENDSQDNNSVPNSAQFATQNAATPSTCGSQSWLMSGYLTKAVTSSLLPSQLGDILAQERGFATAILAQPSLKHACGLARIQKEPRLLIAFEDGFLFPCCGLGSSTPTSLSPSPQAEYSNELKFDTAEDVTVIIENSEIVPDNSYASIVKDDDSNQTAQMTAAMLDWPQGTFCNKVEKSDAGLTIVREIVGGLETIKTKLPAVLSGDFRYLLSS